MRKGLLGLLAILVISGCAAIAKDRDSENKEEPVVVQHPGFGPEINAVLVATGLGFAGWLGGQSARWGIKSQVIDAKTEILAEVDARITREISNSLEKTELQIGRQLDGIVTELMGLTREIKSIDSKIEKRLTLMEKNVERVEGNIDNILPHVNQAIANAFHPYGVQPAIISVRKGASQPGNYGEEQ